MQAAACMASVVSATSCARHRLIRSVRPTKTRPLVPMSPTFSLLDLWTRLGVQSGSPATPEQLRTFEGRYAVTLPGDFRSYLLVSNGMAHTQTWTSDDEGITFWRLPVSDEDFERDFDFIVPASRAWPQCRAADSHRLFVFADWCISVVDFAICLASTDDDYGYVYRLMDAEPQLVARNFDDFVLA